MWLPQAKMQRPWAGSPRTTCASCSHEQGLLGLQRTRCAASAPALAQHRLLCEGLQCLHELHLVRASLLSPTAVPALLDGHQTCALRAVALLFPSSLL